MNTNKLIVIITAAVFAIFGLAFIALPELLSQTITGAVPTTTSGLIDMRATYGGMSLAVGLLLFLLSRSDVRLGLVAVLLLMLSMAGGRTYGILADGAPNIMMVLFLALELAVATVAGVLLAREPKAKT